MHPHMSAHMYIRVYAELTLVGNGTSAAVKTMT